jgi:hypothetical protein
MPFRSSNEARMEVRRIMYVCLVAASLKAGTEFDDSLLSILLNLWESVVWGVRFERLESWKLQSDETEVLCGFVGLLKYSSSEPKLGN